MIDVKEYMEKQKTQVTLTCGDEWTIRKIPVLTTSRLTKFFGAGGQKVDKDVMMENLDQIVEIIIPTCVVDPVVVKEVSEEGQLSIGDISMDDMMILIVKILEWSGMSEEAAEERDTFRKE